MTNKSVVNLKKMCDVILVKGWQPSAIIIYSLQHSYNFIYLPVPCK